MTHGAFVQHPAIKALGMAPPNALVLWQTKTPREEEAKEDPSIDSFSSTHVAAGRRRKAPSGVQAGLRKNVTKDSSSKAIVRDAATIRWIFSPLGAKAMRAFLLALVISKDATDDAEFEKDCLMLHILAVRSAEIVAMQASKGSHATPCT